jgi:phosphoenolpyruvate-protein phosphotransferase
MTMPQSLESAGTVLAGVAASPGVALGPVFRYAPEPVQIGAESLAKPAGSAEDEKAALRSALAAASEALKALTAQVSRDISAEEAGIFEAQALIVEDPTLSEEAGRLIDEQGLDAASAIAQAGEALACQLAALENEVLAARAADIRDVTQRVLRLLQGTQTPDLAEQLAVSPAPFILVARDLMPSETAHLRPGQVLGICTATGGATAHAAIIARAMGIPAVVGVGERLLSCTQHGKEIGLDGTRGEVYVELTRETRAHLLKGVEAQGAGAKQRLALAAKWLKRPGATADGQHILVSANIGSGGPAEAQAAAETWGAEGVGLLRTEFLLGDQPALPGEAEQMEQYIGLFRAFVAHVPPGTPIVARTLDAGADKPLPALKPFLGEASEANPALGLRGVRIHLAYPELLRIQLRALLRAADVTGAALHIMFPMIATLDEVRRARAVFDAVWEELQDENAAVPKHVPVGIMVEVPAAVLQARSLAREVAFFSIGTNDLTQYIMAADRLNSRLGTLYDVLQPAVIAGIAQVAQAAQAAGHWAAVCGESAGDPRIAPLLVGLGITELSMTPANIPPVKEALSRFTAAQLAELADRALQLATVEEVHALLEEYR